MDFPTALTSLSQAIAIAKTLADINKDFDASTFKIQIADLTSRLADAKIALVEAQDEARDKDSEIGRLRSQFQVRAQLIEERGHKFRANEEGHATGFAVCPRCEGIDGRLVFLVRGVGEGLTSTCPECRRVFDLRDTHRR